MLTTVDTDLTYFKIAVTTTIEYLTDEELVAFLYLSTILLWYITRLILVAEAQPPRQSRLISIVPSVSNCVALCLRTVNREDTEPLRWIRSGISK